MKKLAVGAVESHLESSSFCHIPIVPAATLVKSCGLPVAARTAVLEQIKSCLIII